MFYKVRSKGNFLRRNLKINIVIENVFWSEGILMHYEGRPSILKLMVYQIKTVIYHPIYNHKYGACILDALIKYGIGRYTNMSTCSIKITLM